MWSNRYTLERKEDKIYIYIHCEYVRVVEKARELEINRGKRRKSEKFCEIFAIEIFFPPKFLFWKMAKIPRELSNEN